MQTQVRAVSPLQPPDGGLIPRRRRTTPKQAAARARFGAEWGGTDGYIAKDAMSQAKV